MRQVKNPMRQVWLWGVAMACWLGGPSVQAAYVPGTTNLIVADGTTGISYQLYLPTSYTATGSLPLVLYFDPGGRSDYGVEKLQPSCEAAGWILACANDLYNGTVPDEDIRTREVMDDVRQRIPHDRRRFYLSGLSGGAWRANSASREYWGEVAGLLLFGCWIGDYDDYTIFPDRLAVARINGIYDESKIASEAEDLPYYTQTLVRVENFHFDGGHDIGPTASISEGITWLEQDFASNGVSYIPVGYELASSSLVSSAQAAWSSSNFNLVVSNTVEVMYRYPISSFVREAEQVLFQVMTNDVLRSQVSFHAEASNAWEISRMLLQRGLGVDDYYPPWFSRAYFETAILASPTNARALAECAHQLLNDSDQNRQEWPRAAALAAQAVSLKTNHWRAPYVEYEVAVQMGDLRGALMNVRESLDKIRWDQRYWTGRDLMDIEDRYEIHTNQIPPVPVVEDVERLPMNWNVANKNGWAAPWGEVNSQTQVVHNGLCALSFTGRESLVFLNCGERTNETLWVDFYWQPARAESVYDYPLPPRATTVFYVQSNGYLCVYDGAITNWITLAHAAIPTGEWSRVSIQADASAQEWSLSLNDQVVGSSLGFAHSNAVFSGLYLLHDNVHPTLLDDLTVSGSAPLPDRDRDGLPDEWEVLYTLDPDDPSDSGLDPDEDLYANDEEFRLGTSPREWNEIPGATNTAEVVVSEAGFPIGDLIRTNMLYRHHRWKGKILLATSNQASIYFQTHSSSGAVCWGELNADPVALSTTGVVVDVGSYAASDERLPVSGPLNAIYSVSFDESTGEFSLEWSAFNDIDGDSMMDEWEFYYTGSPTGLGPWGNPDQDAYPTIDEYFGNTGPLSRDPYSGYKSVSLATSFNGWSTTENYMTLVGDHVWRYYLGDNNGSYQYKFVANSSWDTNWGDNQQTVTSGTFKDTADLDGANILLDLTNSAYVTLVFHDLTRKYAFVSRVDDSDSDGMPDDWEISHYTNIWMYGMSSDPDGDGWINVAEYLEGTDPLAANTAVVTNTSLSVVGNFSGWNTASNFMQPMGNHLWQLDLEFNNSSDAQFKFVANGTWDTAWGSPDASSFALPLQALGNAQGGSPNFTSSEPLDGRYRFTFNEAAGLCALDYAPDYIVFTPPHWIEGGTNRTMVLEWLSSSYQQYYLLCYTNLLADPIYLDYIPATPPLNVSTQELDPELRMGIFQIRLVD